MDYNENNEFSDYCFDRCDIGYFFGKTGADCRFVSCVLYFFCGVVGSKYSGNQTKVEKEMKLKFFGQNIEPACEYCEYGRLSGNRTTVLCEKKGVVALDFHCRKFRYDPLKRIPHAPKLQENTYSEKDFQL